MLEVWTVVSRGNEGLCYTSGLLCRLVQCGPMLEVWTVVSCGNESLC